MFDQRIDQRLNIFRRHLDQHDVSRLSLDQRRNLTAAATEKQVALPVPRNSSIFRGGRALADRNSVNYSSMVVGFLGVVARPNA